VTFDLLGHLHQHVDLALLRAALGHPGQYAPHPAHTFAAWCALATAFVLIKIRNAGHRTNDIRRLIHHDDRSRAERGFFVAATVEIHDEGVGLILPSGDERH